MSRVALIETATGKVVNVIDLEPGAKWTPPDGHQALNNVDASRVNPGDQWDGKVFISRVDPIAKTPVIR